VVSQVLNSKYDDFACQFRWQELQRRGADARGGKWSTEEDDMLTRALLRFGTKWHQVRYHSLCRVRCQNGVVRT
jgi:hypothetical protein